MLDYFKTSFITFNHYNNSAKSNESDELDDSFKPKTPKSQITTPELVQKKLLRNVKN